FPLHRRQARLLDGLGRPALGGVPCPRRPDRHPRRVLLDRGDARPAPARATRPPAALPGPDRLAGPVRAGRPVRCRPAADAGRVALVAAQRRDQDSAAVEAVFARELGRAPGPGRPVLTPRRLAPLTRMSCAGRVITRPAQDIFQTVERNYWMAVMKLLALATAPRPVMLSQPETDCCDEVSRFHPFRK